MKNRSPFLFWPVLATMTSRCTAIIVFLFLLVSATYGQCIKYAFEFGWETAPGDVVIKWKTDDDCRRYPENYINDKVFIVRIATMFDEVLFQDTVKGNRYRFNTRIGQDETMLFSIKEVDGSQGVETVLRLSKKNVLPAETKIDSLNTYLLNGCFHNAMAIFEDLKRDDLLMAFRKQFAFMFPEGYPDERNIKFFNSYVDPSVDSLVQMAYVYETDELVKALNKATKDRPDKPMEISVLLKISPEGGMQDFTVYPTSETEIIRGLLPLLRYDNPRKAAAIALIKISRPYGKKKTSNTNYEMVNKRALIHPDSPGFRKNFYSLPTGAVHR
jgi:hypothetical protein